MDDVERLNATPFYSAHVRIERAKEHLKDLESQIAQFFAEKPYAHAVEDDPNGTHEIHKLQFTKRFPFRWRVLATEIIEHARASLDHATFGAHLAARGSPDSRYVAFPIGNTAADLDNSIRGRSKDLTPEIQAFLRTLQCYQGGNGAGIYVLNDLCNLSKHALIAFIVGQAIDIEVRGTGLTKPVRFFDPFVWDRAKNEVKYASVERGTHFEHHATLNVFVAIQDKQGSSAISAVQVLEILIGDAKEAVDAIEGECRRLGYIK
jgi:hypothetical protein